ncbi:MAG: HAMP domain-containing sensor histidine kinase [Acidimicrobiia bacterium]
MTIVKEPEVKARTPSAHPVSRDRAPKRSHLQNDFVGGAFTITFLVLVVVLVWGFVWQREILEASALERVAGVAAAQEQRIDEFLADGLSHAEIVATRGLIVNSLPGGEEVVSPVGAHQAMREYMAVARDVAWISVYSKNLDLLATTSPAPIPVNADYLARGLREPVFGNVIAGDGENLHLVGLAIGDPADPVGLVLVAQPMSRLEEMTRDYTGLGETGETTLARALEDGALFLTPLRHDPDAALSRVVPGTQTDVSVIQVLTEGSVRSIDAVDYRGVSVVSAGTLIESANWALAVEIDRNEAMEPLDRFIQAGLAALIVGSLMAAALAWRVSKQIRRPIVEMKDAAMAIARGDRDTVVPNGRIDEIGELVDSFNMMTAELNALTGNLEEQVAHRTAELEQKNQELRGLMEAKETFLAGVSHEVRGPLTAMMGFIQLAGDDSVSLAEERGPMLQAAMQQADEVLILIEDLLAAARAESGTLNVAKVRVNLQAQMAQVMEGLSPDQHDALDVRLTEAVALGDPARIRQIVRNLVSNAFRYGGKLIRIRSYTQDDEVFLVVEDNGGGIPSEDRDHIFDPFVQSPSRREVSESVGIGLHVSRQLAELMSGSLTYLFQDGWSVFTIRLPAWLED